jgi:hypothetical protein
MHAHTLRFPLGPIKGLPAPPRGGLYTDLIGGCNTPHSPHDPGGSVGHGPSHQVSFFFFFSSFFSVFFFSVYIFVF